ncbi:MAG: BolA family transcriptional regulator [Proteobacteria bacterium]|nr:BolA family transcriptional regulator [Pseudomonadota bacterium]
MSAQDISAVRVGKIRFALESALSIERLEISDESHHHAGHAGARTGLGHFHLVISATEFTGQPLVKRHRLVYDAIGSLMQSDIHALGIEAFAPGEKST